jgi:hypothetical protein
VNNLNKYNKCEFNGGTTSKYCESTRTKICTVGNFYWRGVLQLSENVGYNITVNIQLNASHNIINNK